MQALFATDVASRGLDIKGVTTVVNYAPPNCVEDYVPPLFWQHSR